MPIELWCDLDQLVESERRGRGARGRRDERHVAEEREADAHRADQQVLPGGLEGAVVAVEVDERSARECRGLDAHPQQSQVPAERDQGHRREEEQQAPDEDRFGFVAEQEALFEVATCVDGLAPQVAHGVGRGRQEQGTHHAEEEQSQGIHAEPGSRLRSRRLERQQTDEQDVADRGPQQPRLAERTGSRGKGEAGGECR